MQIKDFPGGENLEKIKTDSGTGADKVNRHKPDSVKHNESGSFNGDKKSSPEDNIRKSAAYQKFLEMLQSGETSRHELAFFARPDKTAQQVGQFFNAVFNRRNSNGDIEKLAAQLLIKEIDSGQVKITKEYNQPLANTEDVLKGYLALLNEANKENKLDVKSLRQGEIYDFLCQMHVKGMTPLQMEKEFFGKPRDVKLAPEAKAYMSSPQWKKTLELFLTDLGYEKRNNNHWYFNPTNYQSTAWEFKLDQGKQLSSKAGRALIKKQVKTVNINEKPGARLLTKIILAQPGLAEKNLEQADWEEVSKKLVEALKDVWQDFYYSGRWRYDDKNKEYVLTDEADLDARVSLYLFERAGLKKVLDAQALPPGKFKVRGTKIDLGGVSGVAIERAEAGNGYSVSLDNHQPGRGFETSSAKIIFNLLSEGGLLKPNYQLRALVEMTVDDDNGRLLNDLAQYEKSSHTMRGLYRFCYPETIINFFTKYWSETAAQIDNHNGDKGRLIYQAILDRQLTPEDIKGFNLARAVDSQTRHIKKAKEMLFEMPEDKLMEEGKLINTRLGKCVVNIEAGGKSARKFNIGHDAVKVDPRGFKLYLSYDHQGNSILLNTTDRQIDLYQEFESFLTKHPDLEPVRGALLIKPHDGKPMSFKLEDLLTEFGYNLSEAKGQIKDFLEKGASVKAAPDKKAEKEKSISEKTEETTSATESEKFATLDKAEPMVPESIEFIRELNQEEQKKKAIIDSKVESEANKKYLAAEADKYLSAQPQFNELTAEEQQNKKKELIGNWLQQQKLVYYKKYSLSVKE